MTTPIANQVERLNKAKADIKASIIAKGGIVPDTALIGDYADIIRGFEDMFSVGNYNYRVAANVTSSSKNLTLGPTNLSKLTDAEKAIATNKGWTLK